MMNITTQSIRKSIATSFLIITQVFVTSKDSAAMVDTEKADISDENEIHETKKKWNIII